jgi:beta-galactosidase/beta-glucuronidase
VIAVRHVLTKHTDGLLDLVKITGDFAVDCAEGGRPRLVEPRREIQPASWTGQGHPWYSGRGLYRRRFDLPESLAGLRLILHAEIVDDAAEFLLNGQRVGVRLWPPYEIDVTDHLRPGGNTLEIRVANTLINQLEAVPRPSGLSGSPRLVSYRAVEFAAPH